MNLSILVAFAQQATPQPPGNGVIQGTVVNQAGALVGDALVRLQPAGVSSAVQTKTAPTGAFVFSGLPMGSYQLSADKSALHSGSAVVDLGSAGEQKQVDLVLVDSTQAIEFADEPKFTIAGVTDWTAVGGHGSDSTLRTSETLARETLALKPDRSPAAVPSKQSIDSETKLRAALATSPGSFAANHELGAFYLRNGRYRESVPLLQAAYQLDPANRGNEADLALAYQQNGEFAQARDLAEKLLAKEDDAGLHRLLGELDEQTGNPLAAVHEDELAVRLDPSEQNYFAWGSELLLHRAIWQAVDVFRNGAKAYPSSARMLTALGTALFAGDLYEDAAATLCRASDLAPADPAPYTFMGRIEMASPKPLTCIEPKLARFARQQPENSTANYLYAMAIWKSQGVPAQDQQWEQVEKLLTRAVAIDPKCGDAYLQLGILSYSRHDLEKAIGFYAKAIEADPKLAEAHYRLGVAYDRAGAAEKARQEFQLHDEIEKQQAAAVERQRREIKQFQVVEQSYHAPGE